MQANNKQISGTHYQNTEYQVWDFWIDSELHPLLCMGIKYTIRHGHKSGKTDLLKAVHFLEKATEVVESGKLQLTPCVISPVSGTLIKLFTGSELEVVLNLEYPICLAICECNLPYAISLLKRLISTEYPDNLPSDGYADAEHY